MAQTRFTCTLTRADEPACQSYARVTITDSEGATARGCPRHAVAALDGITGAHVGRLQGPERVGAYGPGAVRRTEQALSFAVTRTKSPSSPTPVEAGNLAATQAVRPAAT
jgi:hypothetical protein